MGGWGGGYAARLFLSFFFPCSSDHERDWPPCEIVFFGLATNSLNVRNSNNNNNNCLECCQRRLSDVLLVAIQKSHQMWYNKFCSSRRITRRQVMRHFTSNDTDQQSMSKRFIKTSLLHIESNADRLRLLSPTYGQRSQYRSGQIKLF